MVIGSAGHAAVVKNTTIEQMMDEFIEKARKDIDIEKAKANAKQFIKDY